MRSWRLAAALPAHAQRVADAMPVDVDVLELLTGRAALLGLDPPGRISAGGASRLLPTCDGWWALTLSRADDVAAVPALVECDRVGADPWPVITAWSGEVLAADAVARARLLGLPAAALGETASAAPRLTAIGRPAAPRPLSGLLVVELASMWAGPLCGRLLTRAGATVVKVETPARPDGTRHGSPAFFDWMNAGKLCCAADLDSAELHRLVSAADVVIEGSRPAALRRRGLSPERLAGPDGRVWLRITGHGADGERAEWVAFGDDAAVSGGLVGTSGDGPVFAGDALADPLTGLHAAHAVVASVRCGGGELIEMSMAAVAATYAALPGADEIEVPPQRPAPSPPASALGADNDVVTRLLDRRAEQC